MARLFPVTKLNITPQDRLYLHTHERTCLAPGFALRPQYEVGDVVTHHKVQEVKGKRPNKSLYVSKKLAK